MTISSLDNLASALARAQAEMENPGFDSQNPHFRSKFASLAAVRNAVIPVLAKYGIACVQDLMTEGENLQCITRLLHSSGESLLFGPLTLPTSRADAQGFGSAATYARRYSLMAVAGVAGDDDDDGSAAVKSAPPQQRPESQPADSDGIPIGPEFVPMGKHHGKKWENVAGDYLAAIVKGTKYPPEFKAKCQAEIDRRAKVFQEGISDGDIPYGDDETKPTDVQPSAK